MQRITVAVLALSLAACNVDTGSGPVGPPGPPGNANVFSLNFFFSMDDAAINGSVASVQYDVPDLTPLVVDEGGILMFFRDQGTWTAMPWTVGVESADLPAVDYTLSLGFGYDVGFLEVFYEASTPAVDLLNEPDREVKLVVIDGSVFGKKMVDVSSWEAVKEAYGL